MKIGVDASRAFLKQRTGIEEYSYQVIKSLGNKLNNAQVILYLRKNQTVDFDLPENWKIKIIKWPYLWTQAGMSLEMLFHPIDVLFIPAHTVPIIHPENTIVTIHGLEYEFCPQAYSFRARLYMRWSIKNSCRWAKTIIAVSNNTKSDLEKLYAVPAEKIKVIHEGYDRNFEFRISNFESNHNSRIKKLEIESKFNPPAGGQNLKPYLLFVGRLEERKNIIGIVKTFEILKEQYKITHKLVLAGNFGYGKEKIIEEIKNVNCTNDIILTGYVSEEEKWELFQNADVFLFPTFYEGFGLPILEAQSAGVPVVAGKNSSIPEVTADSAFLVDPKNAEQIADAAYKLISDKALRNDIIKKGYENVKRFSWDKCGKQLRQVLLN